MQDLRNEKLILGVRLKWRVNLNVVLPPMSRLSVRNNKCCKSNRTKPTENSTAEKIKKKNVKEIMFKLS